MLDIRKYTKESNVSPAPKKFIMRRKKCIKIINDKSKTFEEQHVCKEEVAIYSAGSGKQKGFVE